ncbi:MAG: methyltransferase domain-containing protein [Chitinivibrionales bacterium]|nr:methyltransferase domain-containing protein [Chitinivibrionales bacterium]
MDDFSSDGKQLRVALDNLRIINATISPVKILCRRHIVKRAAKSPQTHFTLMDIGCGSADLADWLSRQITFLHKTATIYCVDHDPRAVAYAKNKYSHNRDLVFIHCSAFEIQRVCESVDFILCNNVLHHFEDSEITAFLEIIHRVSRQGFLVCDLYRSYFSYYGFLLFSALFFRDGFSMIDGTISIRKGFTKKTFADLLNSEPFRAIRLRQSFHAFICLWK